MTAERPVGSVVIAAWNEAGVIGATLDALFTGIPVTSLEVVVACNGCTDGTEQLVVDSGHPVTVLSLPAVGKASAIRAAESVATAMPRLYLDADVELPGPTAVAVLDRLAAGAVAARPVVRYDETGASWPVRSYMVVRSRLDSVTSQLYGAGVYGLSAPARARFDEFPDFTADDLFVARITDAQELTIVDGCEPATVQVPKTVRALIATLSRAYQGNRELARSRPEISRSTTRSTSAELLSLCRSPALWAHIVVHVAVVVAARARARVRPQRWARDETSRLVVTR